MHRFVHSDDEYQHRDHAGDHRQPETNRKLSCNIAISPIASSGFFLFRFCSKEDIDEAVAVLDRLGAS